MLYPKPISSRRIWLARAIAVMADVLQMAVFPVFVEGAASPVNIALDAFVAVILIALVGWHIAFVPSFIVEVLPVADLAPTWTIAVLIATRKKRETALPEVVDPKRLEG